MKIKYTLAVVAAAALLTGCWQKSVYPFFKEKDVFFEEKFVGTWRESDKPNDEGSTWTISKGEQPKVYTIRIADKENKLDCDGRLFKIGETKFLDLHSRNRGIVDMPAHALFRVQALEEASFKVQMLNPDWMKNRLQLHPKEIANVFASDPEHPDDADKGEFILTADTDAIQKFIVTHLNDDGFWNEGGELKRQK